MASTATLYWSETGEVACSRHAPSPGSDSWKWGGWRKVGDAIAAKLSCHSCASIARRMATGIR